MKKIFLILLSIGLIFTASAQRGFGHRGYSGYRSYPRVSIGIGYSPYAPYYNYGYPYYGGYPPVYRVRSSRLEIQINDIRADYKERIWEARHDRNLSHHERKMKVHELKHERDQSILDAQRNYYNRRTY
jgi:hypothetical protein